MYHALRSVVIFMNWVICFKGFMSVQAIRFSFFFRIVVMNFMFMRTLFFAFLFFFSFFCNKIYRYFFLFFQLFFLTFEHFDTSLIKISLTRKFINFSLKSSLYFVYFFFKSIFHLTKTSFKLILKLINLFFIF